MGCQISISFQSCLPQGQHGTAIPPVAQHISKPQRSTYCCGLKKRGGKNAKENDWFIFSAHMLPPCDRRARPPRCQNLLSSATLEISGITIQVGCHSPCGVLTGHAPARTHPSPSKDLFLHHLHLVKTSVNAKFNIQSHCNVKRLFSHVHTLEGLVSGGHDL